MASLSSPFPDLTLSMDILDKDGMPSLDYHQLFFNYLRLLGFDSTAMSHKHRMKFDKDMFKFPNPKAFQHVTHFLFCKLDSNKAAENFRDVWPIVDKKQEAQYRKKVQQWFVQIQEVNKTFLYSHVNLSIFLSPGGDKFVQLLCALASHVLEHRPKKKLAVVPPACTNVHKGPAYQFRFQMIKGSLLAAIQNWNRLTSDFQLQYHQQKELAREMVVKYRQLCLKNEKARSALREALGHSGLSDEQKKSMLDGDGDSICQDLIAEMEKKEEQLNHLTSQFLVYEDPLNRSGQIIDSIIEMKKSRHCIDGKQILGRLPTEFIERYQNEHSGTRLELQFKDGRLDFFPLMNLLLFAVKTAAEMNLQLNFPSMQKELNQLCQRQQSVEAVGVDVERLCLRWNRVVEDQSETIRRNLQSKVQAVPMSLQSVTPYRNLLTKKHDSAVEDDSKTPNVLRTALGMTPAELGAARMKFRPRFSLESAGKRDSFSRLVRSEKMKIVEHPTDSAEPSKPTPLGRTPKNYFNPRMSLGNGPSPMVERTVYKSAESSPAVAKKMRRSVSRKSENIKKLGVNTPAAEVPNAVLERAAEAIVYDLVSLESPIASQDPCFFDPNSSFEKTAFQSRNLIGRSPETESKSSNVDLLRILETSFVSPRRSSLTRGSLAASMNNSAASLGPLDPLNDIEREKGLLDASSASLIDDLLDFSLM